MIISFQIANLLLPIVKALVLAPEAVEIEIRDEEHTTFLTVSVDPSDRGRIIGKQGKTLQSLRLLFQTIAILHERNAVIKVKEPDQPNEP